MQKNLIPIPNERIISRIFFIRGRKVMIDRDLAELYGVETRALNQAVRRNIERFPSDFMFQLNGSESKNLLSQIVISSWGGTRQMPLAFTEQGVAMLSTVLNSERAVQVNIQIIRTFTKLRKLLATHGDLKRKVEEMEKKYDKNFRVVFEALRKLLTDEEKPTKKEIGFRPL